MPEDLTVEERAYARGEWGETFQLEKKFWDWYRARRHQSRDASELNTSTASPRRTPVLFRGW